MKEVQKRDGTRVVFNEEAALQSISQKLVSETNFSKEEADKIAGNIIEVVNEKFTDNVLAEEVLESLMEVVIRSAQTKANTSKTSSHPVQGKNQDIKSLVDNNVFFSEQAKKIIEESTAFDELGRSIFLDRYSLKSKRDAIEQGDLLVVISKEDPKYPKKDLGVVKNIDSGQVTLHMLTGLYADQSNNFEFTQSIWKCDKPLESIKDAHMRIAKGISKVEKTLELQEKWSQEFYSELQKKHIQPAGRIMTGANDKGDSSYVKNLTLFNCYVLPSPRDSRGGIIKETLHQMTEIFSRGGGVGINLSTLRPRYAYVRGVHGKSSGAVSWGGIFSYGTGLIEQGGSRRGALMLMLHDWHPDVLEFITAKRKKGVLENANVSVLISDKFMETLARDGDWKLEFPDYEAVEKDVYKTWDGDIGAWKAKGLPTKTYKTVKAQEIWDQLIVSAHASAEPGVVFMERYNKMSNSHYFNPIICTNPCGEQGLPGWGVCNLGHLYLASFLDKVGEDAQGPLYEVNWADLSKAAQVLTRFLDNVIDATPYHFQENEDNQKSERRVGGGTLGLGEMLIKLRLRYGSPESLELIDKVYSVISSEMYKTSAFIAEEKGPFPNFIAEKFLQSGFMQTMPEDVRELIRQKGIRNVTLTTQAPTGTVGTMLGTSTGIEPYYAFEFFRQSRLGFHKVKIPIAEGEELPDYFITAMSMTPLDHIKVQAAVQKWTDSSISKTANAPENFTVEETKELYEQAYKLGCKGVTIYRDNCRYEQVLTTDENKEQQNAASSEAGSAQVSTDDLAKETVAETQAEEAPVQDQEAAQQVQMSQTVQAVENEEEGSKCELRFDENGQMYKSCSD